MQLKLIPALFFIMAVSFGCTEQKSKTHQEAKRNSAAEHAFFPVTEYILGELNEIDSLPVTPLKIINYNGRKDSTWMKKENIREFAKPFLHPVIDTANFRNLFVQKSFLDQTINAFTISYDPADKLPDTLQLKRWDVYIDPEKNTIKRIYLIKQSRNNGILQTLQLTWKASHWCKITTITEQPDKQPDIKEEIVKWNFND